ncbi:MAG: YqgE/AlgH family protein [Flavobacteriaceae bacterium]|nr:YqgE/AlgH family protein [Flavobacteriaceae bacterium]
MKYCDSNFKDFFNYPTNNIPLAKGRVLIAEPLLQGEHFSRSVILLTEHNENGSMGFVLNKPILHEETNKPINIFPTCESPLFAGGPVHTDHLFYIHTVGHLIPNSRPLFANLFWGGDLMTVQNLLTNNVINSHEIRFFTGYAGWGIGQLANEIEEKSWAVSLLSTPSIMKDKNLWQTAVQELGKTVSLLAEYPQETLL